MRGHGELAVAAGGKLYLLGGAAGQLTQVPLPGRASEPEWSQDHHWLAVMSRHRLRLLRADGRDARPRSAKGRTVTDAAWSPARDVLAVASYRTKDSASPRYRVDLIAVHGPRRVLQRSPYISGLAWSPDGRSLAIGATKYSHREPERLRWHGRVVMISVRFGAPRLLADRRGGVLDVAGWTPDGLRVLYWPDPMGSGSIAADGLPLVSASPGYGQPVRIAQGLTHAAWTAFSPNGRGLATVDGGDRSIWGGHKHIVICADATTCRPVRQPRDVVSLWPTWTPDGTRVVFAQLRGAGQLVGPYGPRSIAHWTRSSRLLVAVPGQKPVPLGGVPHGATAPAYAYDGSLLFCTAQWVWLKPANGRARRVLGPLHGLRVSPYYGYVPYREMIAWSAARPEGYAGTS